MGLIIILILLFIFLPVAYAGIVAAPLFFTKTSAARLMLQELKDKEIVYDLGAGKFIVLAKKEFSKNIYSIEFVPIFWLFAQINLILNGISPKYLKLGDFYNFDFKNIDDFICFLMPKALEKLRPKFESEAKAGTKIISYSFKIKNWQPIKIIKGKNIAPIYVYKVNSAVF